MEKKSGNFLNVFINSNFALQNAQLWRLGLSSKNV